MRYIQLKRLDESGTKVNVTVKEGDTFLGRGEFLHIDATNISRKHALLSYKENGLLELTCLNKNPFFIKKKGLLDWSELLKDKKIEVGNEDEFKFLKDSFHFQILINSGLELENEDSYKTGSFCSSILTEKGQVPEPMLTVKAESKKRKLPQWLHTDSPLPSEKSLNKYTKDEKDSTCSGDSSEETGTQTKIKKSHESNLPENEENSFKQHDEKTNKNSEQCSSETLPSVSSVSQKEKILKSTDLNEMISCDKDTQIEAGSSKLTNSVRRPSCPFGSSCYRKNPIHKREEAHPGDGDFIDPTNTTVDDENDERPECEYGTKCYRKNPSHKRQFKHTALKPKPTRKAKEKVNKDKVENDDSFIDDEEEDWEPVDDSDADEDWAPKQSQETESDDDDDVDVADLSPEYR